MCAVFRIFTGICGLSQVAERLVIIFTNFEKVFNLRKLFKSLIVIEAFREMFESGCSFVDVKYFQKPLLGNCR